MCNVNGTMQNTNKLFVICFTRAHSPRFLRKKVTRLRKKVTRLRKKVTRLRSKVTRLHKKKPLHLCNGSWCHFMSFV